MNNKSGFICRYCGEHVDWSDRDYDMGLFLAERASLDALGHAEGVTPYLICSKCANDLAKIDETEEQG